MILIVALKPIKAKLSKKSSFMVSFIDIFHRLLIGWDTEWKKYQSGITQGNMANQNMAGNVILEVFLTSSLCSS